MAESKVTPLTEGVFLILGGDKRQIKECLLTLRWGDVMFLPYLAGVVFIPLKARAVGYFFHASMYIMVIYLESIFEK